MGEVRYVVERPTTVAELMEINVCIVLVEEKWRCGTESLTGSRGRDTFFISRLVLLVNNTEVQLCDSHIRSILHRCKATRHEIGTDWHQALRPKSMPEMTCLGAVHMRSIWYRAVLSRRARDSMHDTSEYKSLSSCTSDDSYTRTTYQLAVGPESVNVR